MSVNPDSHLIVAFASYSADEWLRAMREAELKNLGLLLRGMKLLETDTGPADSLSPPHERVHARSLGLALFPAGGSPGVGAAIQGYAAGSHTHLLRAGDEVGPDGLIPWAALEAKAKPGEGWAVITPCHWAMGREHATLTDPATLALTGADSRTLLNAMQPYFATEGILLHYQQPTCWLAQGDVFASLPTASLDRVMGRNVDRWLPASRAIKLLQNEMQMLLYTHPINDARAGSGLRTVNSFWVSGTGALSAAATSQLKATVSRDLAAATFANDWATYSQAWAHLDSTAVAQLLLQQSSGSAVRITLCSESSAMTFETAKQGLMTKIKSILSPQRPIDMLTQL